MRKIMSTVLSAALALSLAAPAAAAAPENTPVPVPLADEAEAPEPASNTDKRLAQVTEKVKATLGIGNEYEEFYGELSENEIAPIWNLNWSSEGENLSVEATESGKVLSYFISGGAETNASVSIGGGSYVPAFPAVSREQAQKSAEAFLRKVLDSSESAKFSERSTVRPSTSNHYFNGEVQLNGLPSPLSFSITVRASDGKITRFYRESTEQTVIGGVPSSKAATAKASAAALLKGTMKMRLEYVLDPDTKEASLQYLPEPHDEYYVDAQTGRLVNLTEVYKEIEKNSNDYSIMFDATAAAPEAAADAGAAGGSLSQAELTGIAKLEDVKDKETLDKGLQTITALGLDKYTLASASYSLDKETNDVTARLVYSRETDDGLWRRIVSCNGKTGDLLSVYTSAPYAEDRKAAVSEDAARRSAEAFLTGLWGDDFAQTELYQSDAWTDDSRNTAHSYQFAQKENGYFFPENSLRIAIDITDGSVSTLDRSWTEDVTFAGAEGIVDAAAGLDAWFSHYSVPLAYRRVPVKLDPGRDDVMPLIEMGYSYFYNLKLSYAVEEEQYATGVDAKSGKVLYKDVNSGSGTLTYSDTGDHWAGKQLETLAQYGIGWVGGECQPRKELTQADLVALLVSAGGYRWDPEEEDADELYSWAYSLGILTRNERQDDKAMSRGETVRLLLSGAGFGSVAKLPGIFTCSYPDRGQIPADLLGWAALAQGLGMVSADGEFAAGRTATRAEAAVMLYQLMNRALI